MGALVNKARSGSTAHQDQNSQPKPTSKMADEVRGRGASNVLAKIPKKTMQEMKEAFTMIDQNRDGIIDIEDLKDMYSNLGRIPPDAELNEMLKDAPGPINFTMFLNLFGEKLSGHLPEEIKQVWKEAPLEKGQFDYKTFVGILK